MRYIKVFLLVLLFFVIMMLFVQNQASFSDPVTLKFDPMFAPVMESMPLPRYSLLLISFALGAVVVLAMLLWEFVLPLWLGHGQTLGKKAFGLCLVRQDGIRLSTLQLFARTVLGKCTIETLLPVYMILLSIWGIMAGAGAVILLALIIGQIACLALTRNNCALHDLLAATVVVDKASQRIFNSTDDLIAYQKKIAAERAARADY